MLPSPIVITGAAGNLGSKLRRHLEGRCELRLLDIDARGDSSILETDVGHSEHELGFDVFRRAHTVVHLAGDPKADQTWDALQKPNIDGMLATYQMATDWSLTRFIYASSNHVMGGYKDSPDVRITTDLPPRPGTRYVSGGITKDSTPYATTKLFGEMAGRTFASPAMEVIAVRLGWTWRGDNTPAGLPSDREEWFRQMWLSDRDFCHLMECCLTAELNEQFVIVNGMSANTGMRWDIDETRRLIGYQPQDDVTRI